MLFTRLAIPMLRFGVLGTVIIVAGCGSSSSSSSSKLSTPASSTTSSAAPTTSGSTAATVKPGSLKGKTVGVSMCCPVPNVAAIADAVTGAISNSGMGSKVVNAKGSSTTAQQDVGSFIAQGDDAIWTTLLSSDGFSSLAQRAKQQHIPWVNLSGGAVTGATMNIVSANEADGFILGKRAAAWMQKHNQTNAEVGATQPADAGNQLKTKGFIAGLHSVLPNVKVYTAADNTPTSTASAHVAANLLQAHPNIRVLWAWYSQGGVGATEAARQAGHSDPNSFLVTTFESDPQVIKLIKAHSVLQFALVQNYNLAATAGANMLQAAVAGRAISPTGVIRPTLVTAANADVASKRDASPNDYQDAVAKVLTTSSTPISSSGQLPKISVTPLP